MSGHRIHPVKSFVAHRNAHHAHLPLYLSLFAVLEVLAMLLHGKVI